MKTIFSILFLVAAVLITFFLTVPQFTCTKPNCSYNGITTLKANRGSYGSALISAANLESRRADLTERYNSVSPEDRQRLEALLPNNVDNIKLVLELETLARKYGLLIESPKLETQQTLTTTDTQNNNRAANAVGLAAALPYGTFTLDFTVRSTYENAKALVADMERNLRLIEPTAITIKVPGIEQPAVNTKVKYPEGVYDVTIRAVIYYLKN